MWQFVYHARWNNCLNVPGGRDVTASCPASALKRYRSLAMSEKLSVVVIVGGGFAGFSAAKALRNDDLP